MKPASFILLIIFTASLIPQQYTYEKTGEPLQGYCAVAEADAELMGETLHGNLKVVCE